MSVSDQVFCSKLVEAVEKHPCLYNNSLSEYSNKIVVEKAWKIVAKEVDSSVANCRDRWRNIRTVFSRNLKPGRNGDIRKKPYYLNEVLQFLVPFVKPLLSHVTGNLPPLSEEESEAATLSYDMDPDDVIEATTEIASSSIPQSVSQSPAFESQDRSGFVKPNAKTIAKRRKSNPTLLAIDKTFIDFCSQQSAVNEERPRKMFLLSLLPDVENMNGQQFRNFRMKALLLIEDILSESPTSSLSGTSS